MRSLKTWIVTMAVGLGLALSGGSAMAGAPAKPKAGETVPKKPVVKKPKIKKVPKPHKPKPKAKGNKGGKGGDPSNPAGMQM